MNTSENPYSAPEARVQDLSDEAAVAEKILARIRRAWITGVVSEVGTLQTGGLVFKIILIAVIVASFGNREALLGSTIMFVFSSVFFYFYFYGMLGTYAYHK